VERLTGNLASCRLTESHGLSLFNELLLMPDMAWLIAASCWTNYNSIPDGSENYCNSAWFVLQAALHSAASYSRFIMAKYPWLFINLFFILSSTTLRSSHLNNMYDTKWPFMGCRRLRNYALIHSLITVKAAANNCTVLCQFVLDTISQHVFPTHYIRLSFQLFWRRTVSQKPFCTSAVVPMPAALYTVH